MSSGAQVAPTASWDGTGVSIGQVLDRLAAQRRPPDGGPPLTLAAVLDLIVHVPRPDEVDEVTDVIQRLAGHQPARAILLVESAGGAGIDANVSTSCRLSGGRATVGAEVVVLVLHGDRHAGDASAIRPLLRPDLPTVLWWPDAPQTTSGGSLSRLAPLADRIVTESGRSGGGAAAICALADWLPRAPGVVTDLAWAAVTPWRQLIAQTAPPDVLSASAPGAVRAQITHPGDVPSAEALLLAGWLSDVIGGRLEVEMSAAPCEVAVRGVRIEALASGRRLTLERVAGRHAAQASVTGGGEPGHERALALPRMDRDRLLAGELEIQRRDLAFERALAQAARVACR